MVNENIDENVADEPKKHTAGHMLFQSLKRVFREMKLVKDIFRNEKTALIVQYPKDLDWDKILEAEKMANKIILENRKINFMEIEKSKVSEIFGDKLRGRWDLIKDENIRVVEIENFDYSACMGKHVAYTGEIGMVIVTATRSIGRGEYEIEFSVSEEAKEKALEMGKSLIEISSIIGSDKDKLIQTLSNMKSRLESLEKSNRELSKLALKEASENFETVNDVKIYHRIFEGIDRNEIGKAVSRITSGKKSIAIFANKDADRAVITVGKSDDLEIDIIGPTKKACQNLGGNAGGNVKMASGGCVSEGLEEAFKILLDEIKAKL